MYKERERKVTRLTTCYFNSTAATTATFVLMWTRRKPLLVRLSPPCLDPVPPCLLPALHLCAPAGGGEGGRARGTVPPVPDSAH